VLAILAASDVLVARFHLDAQASQLVLPFVVMGVAVFGVILQVSMGSAIAVRASEMKGLPLAAQAALVGSVKNGGLYGMAGRRKPVLVLLARTVGGALQPGDIGRAGRAVVASRRDSKRPHPWPTRRARTKVSSRNSPTATSAG
jgi:hypothetical protein